MSLYVYVVAVSDEKAGEWEQYVSHVRSLGLFSDHRCWESGCMVEGISTLMYQKGLSVGRPALNSGAAKMESWYGRQVIGENDFTTTLAEICKVYAGQDFGPDENWQDWLVKHNGQTVIVCNDNEV